MIIQIDVRDSMSPAIQRMLEHNERWLRWVTKSVGWYTQKRIKEEIKSGAPGGEPFEERLPMGARKALSRTAKRDWYGGLRNAIGYQWEAGLVKIGWTSRASAKYGPMQEEGFDRVVTSNLRRWWAAAAERSRGKLFNLGKNKHEIEVPKRPVFDPVTPVIENELGPYIEAKVNSYAQENVDYGNRNIKTRKYKVYT